jgi:hypothetical protein
MAARCGEHERGRGGALFGAIPVLWINLERSAERRAVMEDQFATHGVRSARIERCRTRLGPLYDRYCRGAARTLRAS